MGFIFLGDEMGFLNDGFGWDEVDHLIYPLDAFNGREESGVQLADHGFVGNSAESLTLLDVSKTPPLLYVNAYKNDFRF